MERALEGELTSHFGYEKHAAEGRNTGNSRNGATAKSVLTGSGELEDRSAAGPQRRVRAG